MLVPLLVFGTDISSSQYTLGPYVPIGQAQASDSRFASLHQGLLHTAAVGRLAVVHRAVATRLGLAFLLSFLLPPHAFPCIFTIIPQSFSASI